MPTTAPPLLPYMSTQVLAASASSITFNIPPIPEDAQNIYIYWTLRDDSANVSRTLNVRLNSDTVDSNYRVQHTQGNNATTTTAASVSSARDGVELGFYSGNNATSGLFGAGKASIHAWNFPHSTHLGISFNSALCDSTAATCFQKNGYTSYTGSSFYWQLQFRPQDASANFVSGSQITLISQGVKANDF